MLLVIFLQYFCPVQYSIQITQFEHYRGIWYFRTRSLMCMSIILEGLQRGIFKIGGCEIQT